jgi:para-nitrobenzyl esterase
LKKILAIFLFLGFCQNARSQCVGPRFLQTVFSGNPTVTTRTYGQNVNLNGNNQTLQLDVYEPVGDTFALRPLVIWAFGGSFTAGVRQSPDLVRLSNNLARKGYVCASIDYRLGVPDPRTLKGVLEAVARGVHDAKAAIRWFRKEATLNGNPFRIDTNQIFMGGVSAGGIIATHVAYLDSISEYMQVSPDTTGYAAIGGIEGISGNPGYSSKVKGAISISGAIGRATWIQPGDPIFLGLHGDQDNTVPYKTAAVTALGNVGLFVDGDFVIDSTCQARGVPSKLYTYVGAGHVPFIRQDVLEIITLGLWVSPLVDSTESFLSNNLFRFIDCARLATGLEPTYLAALVQTYPNPTTDRLLVGLPAEAGHLKLLELISLDGRVVWQTQSLTNQRAEIDMRNFPSGIYSLRLLAENLQLTRKIVHQP